MPDLLMRGYADFSLCGRYRYRLTREWGPQQLSILFVMLNPSVASADKDDPTIRRCVHFAKREGYDRMDVVNLFAHRATDPREILRMLDKDEPYGPRNQSVIERAVQDAGVIVCAWGAHGRHLGTIRRCSGGSIDGAPR